MFCIETKIYQLTGRGSYLSISGNHTKSAVQKILSWIETAKLTENKKNGKTIRFVAYWTLFVLMFEGTLLKLEANQMIIVDKCHKEPSYRYCSSSDTKPIEKLGFSLI